MTPPKVFTAPKSPSEQVETASVGRAGGPLGGFGDPGRLGAELGLGVPGEKDFGDWTNRPEGLGLLRIAIKILIADFRSFV
ncbi:MAG TPA: hypothetical protein VN851_21560 [Thermoanaerobaculia bacterium]|nr:hypothetical protein [Thermoanaerobaculia bacterium]